MKRIAIIISLAIFAWSLGSLPCVAAGCRRCRPMVVAPVPAPRMEVLMAPVVTRRVWVLKRRWLGGYKLIPKDIPFVVVPR